MDLSALGPSVGVGTVHEPRAAGHAQALARHSHGAVTAPLPATRPLLVEFSRRDLLTVRVGAFIVLGSLFYVASTIWPQPADLCASCLISASFGAAALGIVGFHRTWHYGRLRITPWGVEEFGLLGPRRFAWKAVTSLDVYPGGDGPDVIVLRTASSSITINPTFHTDWTIDSLCALFREHLPPYATVADHTGRYQLP